MDTEDFKLPPLRQDISLHEGPPTPDGSPTWSLYDPSRNQYFRIGWQEFELLSRWGDITAGTLADQVNQQTTLEVSIEDVQTLFVFLAKNNLLAFSPDHSAEKLHSIAQAHSKNRLLKVLRSYLFFKIHLFHPDKFLQATLPMVKPLFSRNFAILFAILTIISLYLVGRQWDTFTATFSYFFNTEGMIYFATTLFIVKVLHELGHAYTAAYYGCKVPSIGVIFLVFWPVLYTDTTDAYRLTSQGPRLKIAAAGIFVEVLLAVIATLLWSLVDDGPLRSACFFVATVSWTFSLLLNINPFLRFDGYYLFSDWLNISNLQNRAFALGKWKLRHWLFGFKDETPELFPAKTAKILIAYALFTWVYRFFLMIAIASLVYYFFFKLAGIVLMILAVIMFIIAPITKELSVYWQRRNEMNWNTQSRITSIIGVILLTLLIIPWKTTVSAPALLENGQHTKVFAPEAAKITSISILNNQAVTQNQLLITLESPELEHKITQAKHDLKIVQQRLRTELGHTETFGFRQADRTELNRMNSALNAHLSSQAKLRVTAPFNGTIRNLTEGLSVGRWVKKNELLFEIVNNDSNTITAFVKENAVRRLKMNANAKFYPENLNASPVLTATIKNVAPVSTNALEKPYLASLYGGDVAVHSDKPNQLLTKDAIYRVVLTPNNTAIDVDKVVRGKLQLRSRGQSLLSRAWVAASAVFIRESGF